MLTGKLIHPEILGALGTLGHGSKVLIADGNYPLATQLGHSAQPVYLNLMPGVPTVTQVLEALLSAVPIEAACVMKPGRGREPEVFAEFRKLLEEAGLRAPLEKLGRFDFYAAASEHDVGLAILSADQRLYANLLLTIGVRA
jgi:L-fucose mutarotase